MKLRLIDYLSCPRCGGSFQGRADREEGNEIVDGTLSCLQCGDSYPVVRSIPRVLPPEMSDLVKNTADTFGWEWTEFRELHSSWEMYERQFLDWVWPIEPNFFKDKVVLDAGCGMGRFAAVAAGFGAKEVVGVDLSRAVESAQRYSREITTLHVVQGDLHSLPFGEVFDFIFSIGVLHHLPDPKAGFMALTKYLKPGGSIFAWVYGEENNGWILQVANPVREHVLSRLPHSLLYWLSLAATLVLHPLLKLVYKPVNTTLRPLARFLPYNGYLLWLSQFGFRHNHHVLFDHMGAPVAFYISREEFESWFREAGLEDVVISWRNQNSWRGWGRHKSRAIVGS